jgi:hypothetical protein
MLSWRNSLSPVLGRSSGEAARMELASTPMQCLLGRLWQSAGVERLGIQMRF